MVEFVLMGKAFEGTKVLAFFAHPDDETMFLGGTLAALAEGGSEVHYLCATRGEGGEVGEPPLCLRSELGAWREKELADAVSVLGGKSLEFLNYQDPMVGLDGELFSYTNDLPRLAVELSQRIQSLAPDLILSHGPDGEYGHPAHIQSYQGIRLAIDQLPEPTPLHFAPCWLSRDTGEFTPPPDLLLDVSRWIEIKVKAASCHQTQQALFLRNGAERAGRPVTLEELIRDQEALIQLGEGSGSKEEAAIQKAFQEISQELEG